MEQPTTFPSDRRSTTCGNLVCDLNLSSAAAAGTAINHANIPALADISEMPVTWKNWHQHVNWLNTTLIIFVPIMGLVAAYWVPLPLKTLVFSIVYYFYTGLGITAGRFNRTYLIFHSFRCEKLPLIDTLTSSIGYHRLWAHRSYKASLPLRIFLAAAGAGAVEGSARWWSAGHRSHHRYTDTDKDPYSVRKGLLYSHIGWMVFKQNPKRIGRTDITDLNEDPVVIWQHRNYLVSTEMVFSRSSALSY
jgi:stearoyl-CoA desaturase (delta-9 desaturase)